MRIGIIGAGGAGLAAAWLLEQDHDVIVFEKSARLGGHAHTVRVEVDGAAVPVDLGFEFFSDAMFPTLVRLLGMLGVEVRRYPLTVTVYDRRGGYTATLPLVRGGRLNGRALRPGQIRDLLQLRRLLRCAEPLMESADTSLTIDAFLSRSGISKGVQQRLIYPLLLAGWCVEMEAFRAFCAYDVLKYLYYHQPAGLSEFPWLEVVGGTGAYIQALRDHLGTATVRAGTEVARVTRSGEQISVVDTNGGSHPFDHLVLATSGEAAARLLSGLPGAESHARALARIDYFTTRIAVHSDPRLMPGRRKDWSVVNFRYDDRYSWNTIWKPWRSATPLFRSWMTFETLEPDPVHAEATYRHPMVNCDYFSAQGELRKLQGRGNLWCAGVYMHDIDSHEGAVRSAVNVARCLAPASRRLALLTGTHERVGLHPCQGDRMDREAALPLHGA